MSSGIRSGRTSARAIVRNAQKEEFKHFAMDLERLLRSKPLWREIARACSSRAMTLSTTVKRRRKRRS
jgi:hypothetical protein